MATWKGFPIQDMFDDYDDWVNVDCNWEYQTIVDVFTYKEICTSPKHSLIPRKVGEEVFSVVMGPETAIRLYHALSRWVSTYRSEERAMEAITHNFFKPESNNAK